VKVTELPKSAGELAKLEEKLRTELRELQLNRALQKLDSPARLKLVRRDLARVLTMKSLAEKESSRG
jgi:ribosomal protein L29